ncbi:hypothetical protein ACS7SF_10050 [Ralstonia sp. 25C]|uniref:hypothetical protein n=1 Tax=Ralstonia sp. 25C TaxID=3447363 RepID=UPI003F74EA66
MPIYNAIQNLKNIVPMSEAGAQQFLDTLPANVQEQLICAIYLGRDHLNKTSLLPDATLNRSLTDHIDRAEYASIIDKKGNEAVTYLDKLVQCAQASKFDLNSL